MQTPRQYFYHIPASGRAALGYAISILIVTILIGSGVFFGTPEPSTQTARENVITTDERVVPNETRPVPTYQNLDLAARAVYVKDLHTGTVLYNKNATTTLPLASITKIMTAVTAVEQMPAYTVVPITSASLAQDGDNGLHGQERFSLTDLLNFSLVASSNDGMAAVATAASALMSDTNELQKPRGGQDVFINKMNAKAQQIGLEQTHFSNVHGLDLNDEVSGSYSSARDTAHMLAYAVQNHPDIISSTRQNNIRITSLSDLIHTPKNTNKILDDIPGLIASKTGYTDLAGGNLAIIFDAGLNQPVVAVVLGSTYEGRFSDMLQLITTTIERYAARPVNSDRV